MKTRKVVVTELLCDECETPLGDINGNPYWSDGEKNYCKCCALKKGVLDPLDYAKQIIPRAYQYAEYRNGCVFAYYKCGRGYGKDVLIVDVEV